MRGLDAFARAWCGEKNIDEKTTEAHWLARDHAWLSEALAAFHAAHGGEKPGAHPWQAAQSAPLEAAARALAHAMLLRARDENRKEPMACFWSALKGLRSNLGWRGLAAGARRSEHADPRAAVEHAQAEIVKWQQARDAERAATEAHQRDMAARMERLRAAPAPAPRRGSVALPVGATVGSALAAAVPR